MKDKKFKQMDKVYIFNESQNPDPEYQTLKALHFVLMPYYEAQIRLRSSWGLKGLLMPNAPGTIDEDYRGEIKVMLHNLTSLPIKINTGERIAQAVCAKSLRPKIHIMDSNEYNSPKYNTLRGDGGFGSTGKN